MAEAIRFASSISGKPLGDGDWFYTIEKGDSVVAEVLSSDAGVESGYIDAYQDRDKDTFGSQSWMITGSTSRNLDTPPFGGQDGIRLHALYPIGGGVAAMVTDFNLESEAAEAFGTPGIYVRGLAVGSAAAFGTSGIYAGRASGAFARDTFADFVVWLTENGTDWSAGDPLGVPLSAFQVLAWAAYGNALLFILVFFGEEGLRFATSQNGSDWDVPDYTLDISLPDGGSVQVYTIGEEKFHLYSSGDGTYRQYRVEYPNGPSGDAFIVEPIIESVIPELGVNQVLAVQAPEIDEIDETDETDESLERFLIVAFTIATL